MKISYNWLKWYIPDVPSVDKLTDVFTYHVCEVEGVEQKGDDYIFDINVLPNRAHDLLSHQGVARELASLLNINFIDPTSKYKIPKSEPTKLEIKIDTNKCRRYMGRVVRNVQVGPSPEWVVQHLKSIGQRSINNLVDAANILMYDSGQPAHVFDLDKVEKGLVIRQAEEGEEMTTLDNRDLKLQATDLVIADFKKSVLGLAGIKGGKVSEVGNGTSNIIIEIANFDPIATRKSGQRLGIFTDARKRFENDFSPELGSDAMRQLSALIFEMFPGAIFEDIVDIYPKKQKERKLSFSTDRISKILGLQVSDKEIEDILKRYNFSFSAKGATPVKSGGQGPASGWEITIPPMRLDLEIEEDMAEEIGRILGYDKVKPKIPHMSDIWKPKQNKIYTQISWSRNKLLAEGYSEVMTYAFRDKGAVEVMQSASDKKFLRTNLTDGLKESMNLNNINFYLFGTNDIKIFEIGAVWDPEEKINVCYFDNNKDVKPNELSLENFCKSMPSNFKLEPRKHNSETKFQMWSLFPFIVRDISVWMPDTDEARRTLVFSIFKPSSELLRKIHLFDQFKKDGKTSCAFRLVFQSFDRTLTDTEVNEIMDKIADKINENGWQVR